MLNFAPVTLNLPPEVSTIGVDLAMELEQLTFAVANRTGCQNRVGLLRIGVRDFGDGVMVTLRILAPSF